MTFVCGIDVGSLTTPADVAWLHRRRFTLSRYIPSAEAPLPNEPDAFASRPVCYALDAPASLPAPGRTRREADRAARTPTNFLPDHRADVAKMRAYRQFVDAGLTIFWAAHQRRLPVIETYPRFVIKTLWPTLEIPSKRKNALRYVEVLGGLIAELGYSVPAPHTHDEIDAMLCALAAEAFVAGRYKAVGAALQVDDDGEVLREGEIIVPLPAPSEAVGSSPQDRPAFDVARGLLELQARSYERAGTAITSAWPAADAMTADDLVGFLERNDYAVLATVTPDGRPQAAPIAYVVRDGSFWIGTVAGARVRNVRANPRAALVIAEGRRNTHSALRAEGDAALHEPTPELRGAWEDRHGTSAAWASAFIELRPRTLFTHANR